MCASLLVLAVGALSSFTAPRPLADRETRTVGAFTEVNLGGSSRVVFRQGSPQRVEVEGSPEALALFETTVSDSQLRLSFRQNLRGALSSKDYGPVTVYVTAPTVHALRVSGSGRLQVEGDLNTDNLALGVSGSGRLLVPRLTATALETTVSGSGQAEAGGTCPRHAVRISGSGQVKARNLKSEACQVRVSGSGNAYLYASQSVDAQLSGSGNVFVAGGARTTSHSSGSGQLRQE